MKLLALTLRYTWDFVGAVPLAWFAIGLGCTSMLWALMDLMAHTLHAG